MDQAHREELSQLSREIQTLQADINKRDYLIQTLENNASWMESQQREMLNKLRSALNEKDRTIEVCWLVDKNNTRGFILGRFKYVSVIIRYQCSYYTVLLLLVISPVDILR